MHYKKSVSFVATAVTVSVAYVYVDGFFHLLCVQGVFEWMLYEVYKRNTLEFVVV